MKDKDLVKCQTCGRTYKRGVPHEAFCSGTKERSCIKCGKDNVDCVACTSCLDPFCDECGNTLERMCFGCEEVLE